MAEVEGIISDLHNSAAGPSLVHPRLLKAGGLQVTIQLTRIMCASWSRLTEPQGPGPPRGMPAQWRHVDLIELFKSGARADTANYRGISLINVPCKCFTLLLQARISGLLEPRLLPTQFGFRPRVGCPEAIFLLRQMQAVAVRDRRPLYMAYIDLKRAFDTVDRTALWRMLALHGVHPTLIALVQDLYADNQVTVRIGESRAEPIRPTLGVRQGCPLSPLLFNVFIDAVARALEARHPELGTTWACRESGARITELKSDKISSRSHYSIYRILQVFYADDQALPSFTLEGLHALLLSLESILAEFGLTMNYKKTKIQQLGHPSFACPPSLQLAGGTVSPVFQFKYLGSMLASLTPDTACWVCGGTDECHAVHGLMILCDMPGCHKGVHLRCHNPPLDAVPPGHWACCSRLPAGFVLEPQPVRHPLDAEVSRRISSAASAYGRLKHVWKLERLSLEVKLQLYNAFVLSALLYCCETWSPLDLHLSRLQTFHNRCVRWIKGFTLCDRITNKALHEFGVRSYDVAQYIEQRRISFVGHLVRREDSFAPKMMLFAHFTGEDSRSRGVGRPIRSYCQVVATSLKELGGEATGLEDFVESGVWLRFADCRVWWRKEMVNRARPT